MKGKVKWYSPAKKYGFIVQTDCADAAEVSEIHAGDREVKKAGCEMLVEGMEVEFEVCRQGSKPTATNLKILSLPPNPYARDPLFSEVYVAPDRFFDLEKKALPERWRFDNDDHTRPARILINYLKYTYYRLKLESAISISKGSSSRLVFNTGLVDRFYEPIYAVCDTIGQPLYQGRLWDLTGFCVPGERGLGKELKRAFGQLPRPAKYFNDLTDLLYTEPDQAPDVDWRHVIVDAIKDQRLPVSFLKTFLQLGRHLPDPGRECADAWKSLGDEIDQDDAIMRNIKGRMQQALETALKRVQWNYKTAIPMWYPTKNFMSLLLPLAIGDDENHIDVALVVEKVKADDGNTSYIGHTVLSLEMAYMDARLVCRPDSDWLVPSGISSKQAHPDEVNEPSVPLASEET